jgi:hypothetical protein
MLKQWNMILIVLTYDLVIFGTFLTRSGVLSSVHAFAQSAITNRSVVAAAIFHGSLNLFSVAPPTPGDPLTPAVIAVVSHWIIALLLVLLAGGHRLDGFPSQPVETPDA